MFHNKSGGKKIISDIYFIPDLRSNIISLGQATEAGYYVRMKDDYRTLQDKEGMLITIAQRSKNRLYKDVIDMVDTQCLQLNCVSEAEKWHARLGHIGRDSMSTMIKKELATGITKMKVEKEMCSSCLLGKQLRHMFP